MPMKKAAIVYDFDGTLAQGNIQEHSFIPDALGLSKADFWGEVKAAAKEHDSDEILALGLRGCGRGIRLPCWPSRNSGASWY